MPSQTGGGSVGQSLHYVNPFVPERSAGAGQDLLIERGLIARPAIGGATRKRKGGFYPSIMKGVLNAGMITGPLVAMTARRMMSRKNGGGKKGEIWKQNKNEAKAILEHYGKPSAGDVQAFALAKRRGSAPAETYLEEYRKRKQEKAEKNQAFKQAKLREKESKAAERQSAKNLKAKAKANEKAAKAKAKANEKAAKAKAKANEKAAKAAAKAATKKNKVPKAKGEKKTKKANAPHPENVAFWESLVPGTTAAPPKKEGSKKSPSSGQKKYFQNLSNARTYLGTIGAPTGQNMSAYVKTKRAGDEEKLREWIEAFKARRPLTMAATKKAKKTSTSTTTTTTNAAPKTAKVKKTSVAPTAVATAAKTGKTAKVKKTAVTAATTNAPAGKTAKVKKTTTTAAEGATRKSPSNGSKKYFQNLRNARTYLGTIGAPTGPNMSAYVKAKRVGNEEALSKWIENFKTRRPLTMATTKKAKKTAPKAATPKAKPLTAVQEENEENEMQGYSENFESEPEEE